MVVGANADQWGGGIALVVQCLRQLLRIYNKIIKRDKGMRKELVISSKPVLNIYNTLANHKY